MTRKFQLGKRSIRKIINMEENITMKAPFILSKKKKKGRGESRIKEKWLSHLLHLLEETNQSTAYLG